jgi:flagellar protein FliJ
VARPFKLEVVLNHRRHREEAARKRYADALRKLRQQQEQLTAMQATRQTYRQDLRRLQRSGTAAAQILMYTRYLTRLDTEIRAQEKVVQEHRQEKEKQRQTLMTALKDRKVIEKLKEHHVSQLEAEEREREQKLLNDVAITRYQRNARNL